jgi:propanediol dehydratase small subunit
MRICSKNAARAIHTDITVHTIITIHMADTAMTMTMTTIIEDASESGGRPTLAERFNRLADAVLDNDAILLRQETRRFLRRNLHPRKQHLVG